MSMPCLRLGAVCLGWLACLAAAGDHVPHNIITASVLPPCLCIESQCQQMIPPCPRTPHTQILTDDQGWGDSGFNCENSTGMCARTPNLDALARSSNSAWFHRFYAASGVCSPTRAALLTGRTNERSCISNALACDSEGRPLLAASARQHRAI